METLQQIDTEVTRGFINSEQMRLEKDQLLASLLRPQPEVVVVSGGPCAGKSTLVENIEAVAAQQNRPIRIVPEVATSVMERGVNLGYLAIHDREQYIEVQKQIAAEYFSRIAQAQTELAGTNGLILCDRGLKDSFAYTTAAEAGVIADAFGYDADDFGHNIIDKVVYMPSVAVGSPDLYEELKTTNATRYEDAEQAAATCRRTFAEWATHPELHLAEHQNFASKIESATQFCLADDQEYEQKWSVDNETATTWIEQKRQAGDVLNTIQMSQSYHEHDGLAYRLRKGEGDAGIFYHFAIKEKTADGNREVRRQITSEEYDLLNNGDAPSLAKVRYVVHDNNQIWHCDYIADPVDNEGFWIFEAEVSSPVEFDTLELPVEVMQRTDFNTQGFAGQFSAQEVHEPHEIHATHHNHESAISKRWKWASVIGNFAIGLAELVTGNVSTLAVAADGLHNLGDTATYYIQADNITNHNLNEAKKNRRRKVAHWIIAASSMALSAKAGVDLALDHQTAPDSASVYAAGASLALNAGLLANMRRKKRGKTMHNDHTSVHEKDLRKHMLAVDVPSAGLALLGAIAQRYHVELEQIAAVSSGLIGAYAFRPTPKNLKHTH